MSGYSNSNKSSRLAAKRRKQHKKEERREAHTRYNKREPCLLVIDNPSLNSNWYGDFTALPTIERFPYQRLAACCRVYLRQHYPRKGYNLESIVFANQREHQDLVFVKRLAEGPDWSLFRKPKVGNSDIDENIQQYIDFYLESSPAMHIFLVGNDLRNHGPIADRLVSENIGVTLLCFFDKFYDSTLRALQEQTSYDVFDIREFMGI